MRTVPKILLPRPFLLPHALPPPQPAGAVAPAIVEDESLAELRGGGDLRLSASPASDELEALRAAEQAAGAELAALRGGEISNSELTTILLILGIIALILIIV
jgi:hypothetical protein